MKLLRNLCRLHDLLTDASYILGVIGLAMLVLIYCAEVIARYFLGQPLDWANDTFSNILCIMIFSMAPHAARAGSHIEINLVPELAPAMERPLRIISSLTGVVVCAFAAWMSLQENFRQFALGIMTVQNHPVPVIWMSAFITYGFASSSLYFLRSLFPRPEFRPVSRVTAMSTDIGASSIG